MNIRGGGAEGRGGGRTFYLQHKVLVAKVVHPHWIAAGQ